MPISVDWDPDQYHRFGNLRMRPALELFSRISLEDPSLVHDIGTGGGEIARLMTSRWPQARVIASDSSEAMLAKARTATSVESAIEWTLLDLNEWRPEPVHDVIFSNAVLHWLPDHGEVLPRLMAGLEHGGQLAVQMPMSWWQPSHQTIRSVLQTMGTAEADTLAASMATPNVGHTADYYDILAPISAEIDIWTTEYQQQLTGVDPVFEWVSGSILRPVITQLPAPDFKKFSEICRRRLREAYPRRPDGTTLFPFRRLFIVATR